MVSALWKACADGDRESVDQLLAEHDVDLEIKDHAGVTSLIQAVKGGHLDIVKALLAKGADPANPSAQGRPESYTTDPAILHELAAARGDLVPYPDPTQYYAAYPPYAYPAYPEQWYAPPPQQQQQPSQDGGEQPGQNSSPVNLPPPEVARNIPCRYYPACRYGTLCMFLHPPAPSAYYPVPPPPAYPPPPQNPSASPASPHSHPLPPNPYDPAAVAASGGYYYPSPYAPPHSASPTHMRSHSEILPSPSGAPGPTSPTVTVPGAGGTLGTPGTGVPPATAPATSPTTGNPPNAFNPPQLPVPVPVPLMAYLPGPPGGPMSPTAVYPPPQHLQHPHVPHPHPHMPPPPSHQPPMMYGPPPPPQSHHLGQMIPNVHMQLQPGMEGVMGGGGGMENMNTNVPSGFGRIRRGSVKDGNGHHGHHGHGNARFNHLNGNGHHPQNGGNVERGHTSGRTKPACFFFPSGRCRNGDDCRFPHVLSLPGAENSNAPEGGGGHAGKPNGHGHGGRIGGRGRGSYRDREREKSGGVNAGGGGESATTGLEGKMAALKATDALNGNGNQTGNGGGGNSRSGSKQSKHSQASHASLPNALIAQRVPSADDFPSLTNGSNIHQSMSQQPQLNGWANAVNGTGPTAAQILREGSRAGSPKLIPSKDVSASKSGGGNNTTNSIAITAIPTAASVVAGTATPAADSAGKAGAREVRVAA